MSDCFVRKLDANATASSLVEGFGDLSARWPALSGLLLELTPLAVDLGRVDVGSGCTRDREEKEHQEENRRSHQDPMTDRVLSG